MKLVDLYETVTEFQKLKNNKVPLAPEERDKIINAGAVWHHGPGGAKLPAVWKSVDPITKKITWVTHTHRAAAKDTSLAGIIDKFHRFIKGTS